MRSHRIDVAVVATAFAVFGLVALALIWSGDWAYAGLARANGVAGATFRSFGPCGSTLADCWVEGTITLEGLLGWHHAWAAYVIGASVTAPVSFGRVTFTTDEYAHMADVRTVFRGAEVAAVLAFGVIGFRLLRARARGNTVRLVRDASLVAAAIVVVIGVAAAIAFDPLFLLFHEVFFPQGNYLFDPATSNLLRLYPEWYWQGVTAGVAVSFVAVSLIAAVAAHVTLRRMSTYSGARAQQQDGQRPRSGG